MKAQNELSGRENVLFILTILSEYEKRNIKIFVICNKTKWALATSADIN
jgi:hypothetical protein